MDAKGAFGSIGQELQQAPGVMGQQNQTSQEALDSKIDENIQKREIEKLQKVYYEQLQEYYMSRKYKELITLGCAEKCVTLIGGDDLSRRENQCLQSCYHKYYRYLAYSNSLYTYLTANQEVSKQIEE